MPTSVSVHRRRALRRVARLTVLASLGALGLTALPVTGSAAPAPRPVSPSVARVALDDARTVAPDTLEVDRGAPLVAVTWGADSAPPAESTVLVRARAAKGGWGAWLETTVEATKDPTTSRTQRVGTEPVWLGMEPKAVQVRLPKGVAAQDGAEKGRVELIDPGTSPADDQGSSLTGARAVASRPSIVSRQGWGADESLRTCGPNYGDTLRGVFVHHTAGSNSYTAAQSASIIRGIYAYHTKSLGWCDIGYNVLVDKYGQAFEGRAGGLDRPVTGAHALGFNTDTWGVSVLGNYETATPTSATMSTLAKVIAWRTSSFYKWPATTTTLTSADSGSKFPKGTKVTLQFISGHRDTNKTSCPGANLYSRLPALRTAVAQIAGYGDSPVYQSWMAKGGAQELGWVSVGERPTPFGVRTIFTSDVSLWSTPGGVFEIGPETTSFYEAQDGEDGWGAPTADERTIIGGSRTDFSKGVSAVRSDELERVHSVHGGIRTYWDAKGGPTSERGMPAAEMWKPTTLGWIQTFENGQVHYTGQTGAFSVQGTFYARLWQLGGPAGRLGYPKAEQEQVGGGITQAFQGGALWSQPGTGAWSTVGGIHGRYVGVGGASSSLGFPLNEEHAWSGGMEQDFEGGTIRWERATGQITVIES
ncbi:N-acetylmuramoyl-L-alanine amidase [Knoellia sp. CPCC 206450]|uniref:N-acetylmuramoyl-L-alanine amidase n=1 Tax=Knoellia tibetensis TaxID=3404798 RepID=UPI003B433876